MNEKRILANVDMTTAVPMRQFDRKLGEEFVERFMGTTHNSTI
jgi:hypothetical protein